MNHKRTLVLLAISALLILNLAAAVAPAFAQGDETPTAPTGVPALLLLIGIFAIILVGVSYLSLNPNRAPGSSVDDEDDEDQ
jgi:hypothetical protein